MQAEETTYNYKVVRQFAIMTVVWGIVGMLVGVIIAAQLIWPDLTFGIPWLSYGRLRPLHTNAVIFAFGGCALFATSYYVVQRTCQVRLVSDQLAALTFWGWQLVIVAAAITLPLGINTSKEYAELEWPIDIVITIVWVAYALTFFGTIMRRKVPHIYVANWFFGGFILTVVAAAHRQQRRRPGEHVEIVFGLCRGAGCDGAVVVRPQRGRLFPHRRASSASCITSCPSKPSRPVYSYRLSVVHFWALIFTYMWAGPHHLHYTALPDWAQSLGMMFSLILLAPSLGRHDQRHHDLVGCMAQIARRPDPANS